MITRNDEILGRCDACGELIWLDPEARAHPYVICRRCDLEEQGSVDRSLRMLGTGCLLLMVAWIVVAILVARSV